MQAAPSSGAQRGQATIQPAYFTSSLFVDALRADVRELERIYSKHYYALANATEAEPSPLKPFELFKHIWEQLGWQWLHLKVLEPRARETFLDIVLRIFSEFTESSESIMMRVVALLALYTFYMSQPSTSVPRTMFRVDGIPIPIDSLERLLNLPESLSGSEQPLKPYVQFVLQTLEPKFLILPPTDLQAQNPRTLPREEVRNEIDLEEADLAGTGVKK
ncbi:uncharacterized protein FOMMEDRAFT_105836, partial [Fomitiporia mediterranea MF3/22]|uniref:uncharacterized protein n=1 Tax=Fomitiporia mediterranea (strain MF3/22) TaxID=694068 RepID=UPI0004408825